MPLVREGKGQFGGMLVLGQSLGDDLLITSGSTRMHGLSVCLHVLDQVLWINLLVSKDNIDAWMINIIYNSIRQLFGFVEIHWGRSLQTFTSLRTATCQNTCHIHVTVAFITGSGVIIGLLGIHSKVSSLAPDGPHVTACQKGVDVLVLDGFHRAGWCPVEKDQFIGTTQTVPAFHGSLGSV